MSRERARPPDRPDENVAPTEDFGPTVSPPMLALAGVRMRRERVRQSDPSGGTVAPTGVCEPRDSPPRWRGLSDRSAERGMPPDAPSYSPAFTRGPSGAGRHELVRQSDQSGIAGAPVGPRGRLHAGALRCRAARTGPTVGPVGRHELVRQSDQSGVAGAPVGTRALLSPSGAPGRGAPRRPWRGDARSRWPSVEIRVRAALSLPLPHGGPPVRRPTDGAGEGVHCPAPCFVLEDGCCQGGRGALALCPFRTPMA
jgi:hypothetical protein